MKSKIEDLQCPCGCELGVQTRLELAYELFKKHGFVVEGVVSCEANVNDQLILRRFDTQAEQYTALKRAVKQLGFKCTVRLHNGAWRFDMSGREGVIYA